MLYMVRYIMVVGGLRGGEVKTVIWGSICVFEWFEVKGIFIEGFEWFLVVVWIMQFLRRFVI